jgi:hypothetical protein
MGVCIISGFIVFQATCTTAKQNNCNGRLYHLRFHRLPELRFWAMEKLGLIPEVRNPDFEPLDPELNSILDNATTDKYASFKLAPHMHGSNQQRQRVAEIAEMCARRHPGDFVEIGAYLGKRQIGWQKWRGNIIAGLLR